MKIDVNGTKKVLRAGYPTHKWLHRQSLFTHLAYEQYLSYVFPSTTCNHHVSWTHQFTSDRGLRGIVALIE